MNNAWCVRHREMPLARQVLSGSKRGVSIKYGKRSCVCRSQCRYFEAVHCL